MWKLVLVLPAVMVGLAVGAIFARGPHVEAEPVFCGDIETRDKVRNILLESTEQALKNHVIRLHEIWMRDDTGQPARAITGARQGVRAYVAGRKRAAQFELPPC